MTRLLFSFICCLCWSSTAWSLPIQLDFTAVSFDTDWNEPYDPPPEDTVSGTFRWEAASIHDPIEELLSVDLDIAGHVYTLREIRFFSPAGQGTDLLGASNVRSIGAGTDDFILQWYKNPTQTVRFAYASRAHPEGIWVSSTFSRFAYTVPAPSTLALGLLVLPLLLGLRESRRA